MQKRHWPAMQWLFTVPGNGNGNKFPSSRNPQRPRRDAICALGCAQLYKNKVPRLLQADHAALAGGLRLPRGSLRHGAGDPARRSLNNNHRTITS